MNVDATSPLQVIIVVGERSPAPSVHRGWTALTPLWPPPTAQQAPTAPWDWQTAISVQQVDLTKLPQYSLCYCHVHSPGYPGLCQAHVYLSSNTNLRSEGNHVRNSNLF